MDNLTQKTLWKALKKIANPYINFHLMPGNHSITTEHVELDYAGQCLNETILNMLFELAKENDLKKKIEDLFIGNTKTQALHTALRASSDEKIIINEHNILLDVHETLHKMRLISSQIREGLWLGYSGKPITDIVHIGIGGSFHGMQFCMDVFADYKTNNLGFYFISDVDPQAFLQVVSGLNPETTLFIVASKSFTTEETLENMKKAFVWLNKPEALDQHFIAITAKALEAQKYGLKHIMPIWEWVGGRYSICSAVNLITCIAIGFEHFSAMLEGARMMDEHFLKAPFEKNIPVMLGLLGIWNNNFLNICNHLILVYAQNLELFVPFVQQLDMESNGKSMNIEGEEINYHTGPIVWGGLGDQAQHSFFQLLCQGTHHVAVDLISVNTLDKDTINTICEAHEQTLVDYSPLHKTPIIHLKLKDTSPKTIGALVSLYEHKIYTQGAIWNINSFDQPGVEKVKHLKDLLKPHREKMWKR